MSNLKNLSLGLFLIVLCSSVLLAADWGRRKTSGGPLKRIAIFQFASRPILDDSVKGGLEGLRESGYQIGKNLEVRVFNAENDLPTASSIASTILDEGYDLVMTFSTPCLQVMASANKKGKLVHVFGAVTDPFSAGVGITKEGHPPHLIGIGTFQPVKEAFRLAKKMNPDLRTVGTVWNPSEACSAACTRVGREVAHELGIELIEANVDSTSGVLEAGQALAQRGVQALWMGGDNTVELANTSVIRAANEAKIPVFANAPTHAAAGALFGLGADYLEVGRITGRLAARVLQGLDPASVKIEKAVPERLVTNPTVLGKLRESWKIPDQKKEKVGKLWNIRFIQYVEEGNVEAAKEGLLEELKKMGLSEGNDFHMRFASAQGDLATLNSLFDSLDEQCDLIVALSTPTLQCALKKARGIPVIFTNVADAVRAGAGKSNKEHLPNVTGVLTMSDFDGMVEAVKECLPDAKRIGTLFVPAEINSVIYRDALAASAEKAGLTLESVGISSSSEIADGALSLGAKNLDAICQISDNTNNVGFAGIVQAARKEKIPLFAFVGKQVKSEGAVAGVTRDYEQAGRDAAQMVGRVMRGESPANIPFELVSKTVTLVNLKNAALFGLNIPASFLKKAKRVD